ncbi:RES family NAD+ phosphorylase [Catenulispora rubra]|uniref:RES family NAD+ phosphorylase n=1 Tax=Catenulispora rubra TaxID=280293 RepID=UPI0018920F2C|nr:RES family NAD+ phosphorylase [Catenulispora rubra]
MPRPRRLLDALRGEPVSEIWDAGTVLYRVHRNTRAAEEFNPVPADPHFQGGRFDATRYGAPYPYSYVSLDPATAITETIFRDKIFTDDTQSTPRVRVADRRLSEVVLEVPARLVSLVSGPSLSSLHTDAWLVTAEEQEYAFTRRYGHWIREMVPWAQGFVWHSRRNPPATTGILFGDRFPGLDQGEGVLSPGKADPLDLRAGKGLRLVREVGKTFHVAVAPERVRPAKPVS